MITFLSFQGTITAITNFPTKRGAESGCRQMLSLENKNQEVVHFITSKLTYFHNHQAFIPGDNVIGFYDANTPVPLIYPPRYRALVVAPVTSDIFLPQITSTANLSIPREVFN